MSRRGYFTSTEMVILFLKGFPKLKILQEADYQILLLNLAPHMGEFLIFIKCTYHFQVLPVFVVEDHFLDGSQSAPGSLLQLNAVLSLIGLPPVCQHINNKMTL